jgi:hypothetical protein
MYGVNNVWSEDEEWMRSNIELINILIKENIIK